MTSLALDDQRQLEAAEGWLGLGNHLEANAELENIRAECRAHPVASLCRSQKLGSGR